MLRNYLVAALGRSCRATASTPISIASLPVGFAVAMMVGLFVRHELSYDRFLPITTGSTSPVRCSTRRLTARCGAPTKPASTSQGISRPISRRLRRSLAFNRMTTGCSAGK